MAYECEYCGAVLDPGEKCDCTDNSLALRCVQAPVISEDLEGVKRQLDLVLNEVAQLPADDNSLKRVKAIRADISKRFAAMEEQRKEVRRQVMQPYTQAEEKYKACIADPYRAADAKLKTWVDDYQNGMKQACEDGLREYFDELCQSQGVDFLRFSQAGVTVDMAMARQKEPKKAMEKLEAFVLEVRADLDTILKLEDAAEVLAEYRESLDLLDAILKVKNRKQLTAYMARQVREAKEAREQEEHHRRQLLDVMGDIGEQLPQEDLYTMTFTVTGSLPDLKALKAYILSANLTIEEDENEQ